MEKIMERNQGKCGPNSVGRMEKSHGEDRHNPMGRGWNQPHGDDGTQSLGGWTQYYREDGDNLKDRMKVILWGCRRKPCGADEQKSIGRRLEIIPWRGWK